MNIDKVYISNVYKVVDKFKTETVNNVNIENGFRHEKNYSTMIETRFVKKALVYFSVSSGYFIDLETNDKYFIGFGDCNKGDLFVYIDNIKIYGKELMGTNRKYYSKKKILKKYIEYKVGENNEC